MNKDIYTLNQRPWIEYLEIDEETGERKLRADTPEEIVAKYNDFINSNNTLKVTTALDFIFYYAGYAQKLQFSFKIDVENILPLLKERVAQLKHRLLKEHQENKWNTIETNCYVFEMSTGQKIL